MTLTPPRTLRFAFGAILALSALTACGGSDESASDAPDNVAPEASFGTPTEEATAGGAPDPNAGESSGGSGSANTGAVAEAPAGAEAPVDFGRKFIVNASITIETDDVDGAVRSLEAIAARNGGAIFNSDVSLSDQARGTVTVRVPPAKLGALKGEIADLGKVVAQGQTTDDVTEQYVDLEGRIVAAQASVDRVLSFYEKATDVKTLTALEADLTRRQADLETLLGQRRVLDDKVGLATIVIELYEPAAAPTPKVEVEPEDPSIGGAFTGALRGLGNAIHWIGIVLAALLPFAVVAVAMTLVVRSLRSLLRRGRPATPKAERPAKKRWTVPSASTPQQHEPTHRVVPPSSTSVHDAALPPLPKASDAAPPNDPPTSDG